MRDDHDSFRSRDAEILAIGPDDAQRFRSYWADQKIPYIGLPDPRHVVAKVYRQQVKLLKWGRMPLVCIVDRAGRIRFTHYGASMSDIPSNETLFQVIDELNASSR